MTALFAVAPAKLNLALHIVGKRDDGYHLLESLVAFTDIGDAVRVAESDSLTLHVTGPFSKACGKEDDNLVLKAARLLTEHLEESRGAKITLEKQLPVGAGLGGGSSDAATACKLLLRLWGRIMPERDLAQLLLALGADMPMCVAQRPLIARGIGEDIELLERFPSLHVVLCWPDVALPTAEVYGRYQHESREIKLTFTPESATALLTSLSGTRNLLQRAAVASAPEVGEALLALETLPQKPFVRLTGSGACAVAYFSDEAEAAGACSYLSETYPHWWVRQAKVIGR